MDLTGRTVLVTGASGFVGRALCRELRRRGAHVRAALRTLASMESDADETTVVGEIGPDTDWSAALRGVTFVAHLAARVHQMKEDRTIAAAEYTRVNVAGTRTLASNAAEQGVRRFVFLSSVKACGESTGSADWPESSLCERDSAAPVDAYGRSKRDAELAVIDVHNSSTMECVVIRPTLVYGPGVGGNFLTLLDWIRKGRPLPLGRVTNRRSLVYLGNLVDAICCCLSHPSAAGKTYFVCDDEVFSTPELARFLAEVMGKASNIVSIPLPLLRAAAWLAGKETAVQRVTESLEVSSALIQRDLGWAPPYPASQGLIETVGWFQRVAAADPSENNA